MRPRRSSRRNRMRRTRLGTATVELALCMPLLLGVALGMIETSNAVFIQGRIQAAAYEAARLATRPTTSQAPPATTAQVTAYGETLLAQLGVNGGTITVTPSNLSNLPPQTLVTVSITAPWKQNTSTSFVLSESLMLSAAATLIVE